MGHRVKQFVKVNVRVKDLQDAIGFFEGTFGAKLIKNRGSDTIGDFDGATVDLGGVVLDLVAPNKPDGALARSIEKRGEGLDSLVYQVDNLEDTAAALKSRGIPLINRHEYHGHKIGFIHPRDAHGILIELIERAPGHQGPSA